MENMTVLDYTRAGAFIWERAKRSKKAERRLARKRKAAKAKATKAAIMAANTAANAAAKKAKAEAPDPEWVCGPEGGKEGIARAKARVVQAILADREISQRCLAEAQMRFRDARTEFEAAAKGGGSVLGSTIARLKKARMVVERRQANLAR